MHQSDLQKFIRGIEYENPIFWSRFGEKPELKGTTVLEIGSGWGSLCVEMALEGPAKVVGLDIDSDLIEFANENLNKNFPHLMPIVEFKAIELKDYTGGAFNFIVSKDSFDHIAGIDALLFEMKKRLKAGGRIYAGFGPLYYSPYGDHDRRCVGFRSLGCWGRVLSMIPWGHILMESFIIKMQGQHLGRTVNSMVEIGLNKLSVSDFRAVIAKLELDEILFRVNQSTNIASKVFSLLRKIRWLENFFTHNIYCILEKPL